MWQMFSEKIGIKKLNPHKPSLRMQDVLLLHLSLIPGVGPATVKRLLEQKRFVDLYGCSVGELVYDFGLSTKGAQSLVAGLKDRTILEVELELIHKHDIRLVTLVDPAYPPLLKEIDAPPTVLYYHGTLPDPSGKNIAVIGSRKAGSYAREVAAAFVPPLSERGWSIISGGALGADSIAHEQALASGAHTVAILGSGLLCPYPYSNKKLFERIAQSGGAVISSFPLRMQPVPGNFPARNRIISGMSQACLVLQAAERSGASITAHCALDQGRLVLAVPGSIFDPLSAGCHALIKEGATPVSSARDLLVELGEQIIPEEPKEKQNEIAFELAITDGLRQKNAAPELLLPDDKILYYCRNELSFDDLLLLMNLPEELLQEHIFNLQLAGKLRQNAVGLWQAG